MFSKKTHLYRTLFYLTCIFFVLGMVLSLKTFVPSERVNIYAGNVDLTGFDFDSTIAFVDGEVEFYYHKLLSPSQLNAYTPDGYSLDKSAKYTTARVRFYVPDGEYYMIFGKSPEFASRIFINGHLAGEFGRIDERADENGNLYKVASYNFAAMPVDGCIEIVTQSAGIIRNDPSYDGFYIGEYNRASYFQLCDQIYQMIPIGIFLTCTIFYLGFFVFTPSDKANLWFALLSLSLGVLTSVTGRELLSELFPKLDYSFIFMVRNGSLILINVFYVMFAELLFHGAVPKLFVRIIVLINASLMLLLISLPIRICAQYLDVHAIIMILTMLLTLTFIILQIKKQKDIQIISLIGQLLFLFGGASDLLRTAFGIHLIPFISHNASMVGMLLFVFSQMLALYLHNWESFENVKRLELENAALERLNNLKTKFLGNISHELKTPLTVISNYAQLTRRHAEKPEINDPYTAEKMKLVSSEAKRLSIMVGQIIDVSRAEESGFKLDFDEVDLKTLLEQVVKIYYPVLNKNHNKIVVHVADSLPKIYVDAERITQVIVNLISNALRFTKHGIITITVRNIGSNIEISVSDTGIGMTAEQLSQMFNRFYTSGNVRNAGTGLGLYICKMIIEKHEGEVKAESIIGKGTTVCFTLPLKERSK